MRTVYKVEHNESYCILFTLQDALDTIKYEIEENYTEEDHPLDFEISVGQMKQEDIDNLPEFSGF